MGVSSNFSVLQAHDAGAIQDYLFLNCYPAWNCVVFAVILTLRCNACCRCCHVLQFEMVGEDDPSNVISAPSATACLCLVLTAVNKARYVYLPQALFVAECVDR